MAKTFTFLFIVIFTLLLTSCFDIECINRPEVKVNAFFYDYDKKIKASPDSVTLHGIDNPVKIHDNQKNLSSALFPLKASENETEFVIRINGTADTIRFVYSNSLQLISKECGYLTFHKIDTLYFTTNGIDSISLTNRDITPKSIENVAIFY
jgi:hypothetical protein